MEVSVRRSFRWHINLVSLSLLLTSVLCVEENQPAIFLSPRNFNPHPYEAGYDLRDSTDVNRVGPVVFPPAPPEDDSVTSNVITLPRERQLNHPVDNHPYSRVATKRKFSLPSRFGHHQENDQPSTCLPSNENVATNSTTVTPTNDINPRVYEALSNHAAKVLSEPASQLRKDYTLSSLSNQRKNYAFSYKVVDHLTGDDFSHTQSQNSRATNGEYRVKLPDGRVQIVSYIADKNGYKADVKYTENDISAPNIQIQHRSQIRPIPILGANSYDYQYDHISGSHLPAELPAYDENKVLYAPPPTQRSKDDYRDYNTYGAATPQPSLYPKSPVHFSAGNPQPKVEIYTNNDEINGLGNYVGSTVAPYLFENAKGYRGDVVGSTVAPTFTAYTPDYNVY